MDPRIARQLALAGIALALLALLLAPNAHAEQASRLDDAAVFFSHRHPTILCPTVLDWDDDPLVSSQAAPERVLGYTQMFRDEIVLSPEVCEGTRGAADPRLRPEERAVGILVLVHEALHVRRWQNRWVEARSSASRSATSPRAPFSWARRPRRPTSSCRTPSPRTGRWASSRRSTRTPPVRSRSRLVPV
jgi:hypothetical protein